MTEQELKAQGWRQTGVFWSHPSRAGETCDQPYDLMSNTRPAVTHTFTIDGHQCYLTVGLKPDGQPHEIFITMQNIGSTGHGFCAVTGRLISTAIQAGVPLATIIRRMKDMAFAPSGFITKTDSGIREASSVVDYIAQWLEKSFTSHV